MLKINNMKDATILALQIKDGLVVYFKPFNCMYYEPKNYCYYITQDLSVPTRLSMNELKRIIYNNRDSLAICSNA